MAHPAGRPRKDAFLPTGVAALLRRRLLQTCGLSMVAAAAVAALALLSYSPDDPSLNTAGDRAVSNLLGGIGATVSDLMVQSVGVATVLPLVAVVVWGARLFGTGRMMRRPWLRSLTLVTAVLALAVAVAPADAARTGGLPAGLGGSAGILLFDRLAQIPALLGLAEGAEAVTSGAAAVLAVAAVLYTLGLSRAEWALMGLGLGAVANALKKLGGLRPQLQGLRGLGQHRRARADDEALVADGAGRREPQFTGDYRRAAPPAAPAADLPPFEVVVTDPVPAAVGCDHLDDDADLDVVPVPAPRRAEPAIVAPRPPPAPPPPPTAAPPRAPRAPAPEPTPDEDGYLLPPLGLLTATPEAAQNARVSEATLDHNARALETVLSDFGVNGKIGKVWPGPVVTLYELEPAPGTKTSRVIGLADDIARQMSALSVRIAVIPGRSVIGIEMPNAVREMVYLRELLESETYDRFQAPLALVLGKDIGGVPTIVDLARMPHLLVAGTTGSGKSVAINTMILSLLYRLSPAQCRFIMIDPKMLELSVYDGIPHLLAPVVTEPGKAVVALKWAVREMEDRYRAMSQLGVRNISGYNQRLAEARARGETLNRTVQTGFDTETGKPIYEEQGLNLDPLPFIVVVVDEMADLMLVAGKDIEGAVQRLAQMARAAGIHVIMATQRPSVDVITGTIKANFPTRISFQVTSKIDSRTILGEQGAEQLLGQGDMLYMAPGGRILRVHGPFVGDKEVEAVVEHLRAQGEPAYVDSVTEEEDAAPAAATGRGGADTAGDALFDEAVALVARERKASTSFIQRHLQIGYNRAARIIERMEEEGVVSRANHVGKREVLVRGGDE